MPASGLHIAMWSGPRNISTAMMRSWGNRPDTFVCDEPFYAYYLKQTGLDHPMAAEIIAGGQPDWRAVANWLTGQIPEGKSIFYQKQMTHHLLPEVDRSWLAQVTNCFLIRHPREVIVSYLKKNYEPTALDVGFPQQAEIFDWVCNNTSQRPPVIDARDVLENPRQTLGRLCESLGVPLTDRMLSWPAGFRRTDGIWAPHWYTEVVTSTSFQPYRARSEDVPKSLQGVLDEGMDCYERLYEHRLK
jgi:hypothetical protein